jgi:hypothetical protein
MEANPSPDESFSALLAVTNGGRYLARLVRGALLVIVAGYTLDVAIVLLILPASGPGTTMAVGSSSSEDPYAMMSLLSWVFVGIGHGLLVFSLLLWALAKPGFFRRVQSEGADQIVLVTGLAGFLGLLAVLMGAREISTESLTYVNVMGVDLLALLTITIAAWVRLGGSDRAPERRMLGVVTLATLVTGLTSLAVSVETSWLAVICAASTLVALQAISKLLEIFPQLRGGETDAASPNNPTL